ncbi:MAG: hypothetical protein IJV29_07110 [Butyrivibrio sp.]|nr:hypothetical protein [Butyrivibrio sp.]
MTDKEKIRAEIVKLKYQYDKESDRAIRYEHPDVVYQSVHAKYCLCKYILEFIDSLQEESMENIKG